MLNKEIYLYKLESILDHIEICEKRYATIKTPEDFVKTEEGLLFLDAIVVRLQAIGENIKNLASKNAPLLENKKIEWDKIIRFRDFISHHYELLDYEIVFEIGQIFLPKLKMIVESEIQLLS